ncbi:MAG: amino acid/amide transporter substrate-binding protein family [Marmoricola sp.]|nr:amino acid/amide transporter substrate-binding protein family [Marmoricola sp.]
MSERAWGFKSPLAHVIRQAPVAPGPLSFSACVVGTADPGRRYGVVVKMHVRAAGTALGVLGLVMALAVSAALTPAAGAGSRQTAKAAVGSCSGFRNRVGMTNKVIRIGNSVDITGPVPGLYTSAEQATRAYVAFFNSMHRICGRRLVVDAHDSGTSAGADRTAYVAMCGKDFASVGSMAAFDNGGASTAQACRLPDLRVTSSTSARNACASCFGVDATRAGEVPNSQPDFFVRNFATASRHAALLYLNAGSLPASASSDIKVDRARGMTFVYTAGIGVAEFNYGPYVHAMKSANVQWVEFVGPYQDSVRLAQAMQSAGFDPQVSLYTPAVYVPTFSSTGGSAVEGSITAINFLPLGTNVTELNRYRWWLHKLYPGAVPTAEGLFAWSAAKLFTTEALELGSQLTRRTLIARVRTVTRWTGGGMHAPMAVGTKHVSPCVRFLRLHNGVWASFGGTSYQCAGVGTAH